MITKIYKLRYTQVFCELLWLWLPFSISVSGGDCQWPKTSCYISKTFWQSISDKGFSKIYSSKILLEFLKINTSKQATGSRTDWRLCFGPSQTWFSPWSCEVICFPNLKMSSREQIETQFRCPGAMDIVFEPSLFGTKAHGGEVPW